MSETQEGSESGAGTPGQRKRADELVALAIEEFEGSLPDGSDLLPGEIKMLRAAAMGEVADLASEPGDETDLDWRVPMAGGPFDQPREQWGVHRTVRAIVLRWVCASKEAQGLIDPLGVAIEGALIAGKLDLDGAEVPFRVGLFRCAIPSLFLLRHASIKGLYLNGSVCTMIYADGVKVAGTVFLNNGFVSHGEVCLVGATIGGDLSCRAGTFNNTVGRALGADAVKVAGNVNLNDGFVSHGDVCFASATIGRDLVCRNSTFNNAAGNALVLQGALVGGAMFFGRMKVLSGVINMVGARTGYLADDLGAWPDCLRLTDFRYRAIYPDVLGSVKDRLVWIGKSDRTCKRRWDVGYLPDPQPYRQLAKVLREQGHEGDARLVMLACARRRELARFGNGFPVLSFWVLCVWSGFVSRRTGKWDWKGLFGRRLRLRRRWRMGKTHRRLVERQSQRIPIGTRFVAAARGILMLFYGMVAGHGYNRLRPLYWVAGCILFGGLLFSDFDPHDFTHSRDPNPGGMQQTQGLAIKNAQDDDLKESSWVAGYPAFRPIAYSADAFLPLVNLHQETYWTPKDGWVKSVYLPLHILMGWVVTTLAAVSITGLVRHEKE